MNEADELGLLVGSLWSYEHQEHVLELSGHFSITN